ncbi:UDP-glucose dehydrogenase family protein [Bosea sp. NBC_00550]|uniref:UDP-glucose dehydrogenase family protein n=1 Tax=Bosea sp. NBC_00550 TaxID=2969621 RepID=UPI00222F1542|nr:nucleotide sugar dehydrogenase [Bosea sp. NBC_00550]UZF91293.1 nucleotide sugar dehydrogenase [Bosea sp. NBC_00550]
MKVAVMGLWHLGSVTAACLADLGHQVVGIDPDAAVIDGLMRAVAPVFEPGLAELIAQGLGRDRLRFTSDVARAGDSEILWVTFDTPVDENDVADVDMVVDRVKAILPYLAQKTLVLISSQVPVGTTRGLIRHAEAIGRADLGFGCAPENLRLGKAIDVFLKPDRIVVGLQHADDRSRIEALLSVLSAPIEFMSIESAEVTKHAINAFLAMSVAYANEIAAVCEATGADARQVTRGLRTEARIGSKAYVAPGPAFAGGTLARDIAFLSGIGETKAIGLKLLPSVAVSNDAHKSWALRSLRHALKTMEGRRIAVLGLTYKAGTDTLRRSWAVELVRALLEAGADVVAHDPVVTSVPHDLPLALAASVELVLKGADAAVVATEWPQFQSVDWPAAVKSMRCQIVVDPYGMIGDALERAPDVAYLRVGYRSQSAG